MKKILLIIAAAALLLGLVLFLIALAISGWNIHALSNSVIESKTYTEPSEIQFDTLKLDFENTEIAVQLDPNAAGITLTYPQRLDKKQNKKNEITITENGSTLTVSEKSIWHQNLLSLWDFEKAQVTLILPTERAYDLTLKTANGSIVLTGNITNARSVNLRTANGRIDTAAATIHCNGELKAKTANGMMIFGKVQAASLSADADNGMIELITDTEISEKLSLSTNNGKVVIKGKLSANEIELRSDNGNIICEKSLQATVIRADTDNGNVRIGMIHAKEISLSTDNGDLATSLFGNRSDYTVSIKQDVGKSNITASTGGDKQLELHTNVGNIDISFSNE